VDSSASDIDYQFEDVLSDVEEDPEIDEDMAAILAGLEERIVTLPGAAQPAQPVQPAAPEVSGDGALEIVEDGAPEVGEADAPEEAMDGVSDVL